MQIKLLRGIASPATTPMIDNNLLDVKSLENIFNRMIQEGVSETLKRMKGPL